MTLTGNCRSDERGYSAKIAHIRNILMASLPSENLPPIDHKEESSCNSFHGTSSTSSAHY